MSENATNEKNCRHGIDRSIVLCTDCDAAEGRFLERAELTKQINDLPEMLRQYVHDLEADADPAGDKMRIVCLEENMAGLTDEIDRQRAEIDELRAALEALYDEQNGPPLFAREHQWKAAMERARVVLAGSPDETEKRHE